MCGIFGVVSELNKNFSKKDFRQILDKLFVLSESRGKEVSGFAYKANAVYFHKTPQPSSKLLKSKVYKKHIKDYLSSKLTFTL